MQKEMVSLYESRGGGRGNGQFGQDGQKGRDGQDGLDGLIVGRGKMGGLRSKFWRE